MVLVRLPAGVNGVPRPMSSADARKVAESSASSQVEPIAATAIAPSANPVSTVTWLIARSNERPIGKRSCGSNCARLAARAPAKTGAMIPLTSNNPSNAATGIPGITITPMHTALNTSQTTNTRRAGNRSATDESSIPPSA